jgi:hypothetical protein
VTWLGRHRRLVELRRTWGTPVLRERRLDAIAASDASRRAVFATRALDVRTWTDLDLDAVFAAIDRTTSTLGQHALYYRLRTAPCAEHLRACDGLVEWVRADSVSRERAQIALSRLQDPLGYDVWWLGAEDAVDPRPWYRVFPVLTAVTLGLAAAAVFWHGAIAAFLIMVAVNLAVRYATGGRTAAITRSVRQLAPLIATAESLRFVDDVRFSAITGPLRCDVPSLARLKLISRWTNGNPFMLSFESSQLALLLSDVLEVIYEYCNTAFLLDATGVHFALADLRAHRSAVLRTVMSVGEVDAAISVASYREGCGAWTSPLFTATGACTEMDDARHPLVVEAIPNSIALRPGSGMLVTGSNMSGKSTFLRTVGVNAVLAQTIGTCLASRYTAPVLRVRSCIGRSDDLVGGKSYYLAEVEALLDLVLASGGDVPCLFLLDEIFRGTNACERIAAGEAVLRALVIAESSRRTHDVCLAATHDAELVDLLFDILEPWHFGDSLGPEGLAFDHRLREGPATTRNAIALLRFNGAPEALVSRATTTADRLERQRGTALIRR